MIWYGLDERQRILRGGTGGEIAAPVWGRVMRQVAPSASDWAMPGGVEARQVDETGSIVGEGCPTYGQTRTEYFLSGTAPIGECYRDPSYYQTGWYDSLGAYTYDSTYTYPYDTTSTAESSERFWERMRERVFGREDSLGVRQSPETTLDTAPDRRPTRAEERVNEPARRDTTQPPVLGEPVRGRQPPPDTSGATIP